MINGAIKRPKCKRLGKKVCNACGKKVQVTLLLKQKYPYFWKTMAVSRVSAT